MISEHRRQEILLAVQKVYQDAELNFDNSQFGIVPLYDLIRTYPIRVAELQNMTPQRVADFLESETGQKLFISDNQERPLAGYLYLQEYQGAFCGCILVEKTPKLAPISRRRFSAAHELGHYILHFLPLLLEHQINHSQEPLIFTEGLYVNKKLEIDEDEEDNQDNSAQLTGIDAVVELLEITPEEMEEEADCFAAELLMPKTTCYTLAQRYQGRFGKKRSVLAGRLANEFLVSKQAMERRLNELQLPESLNKEQIKQWV